MHLIFNNDLSEAKNDMTLVQLTVRLIEDVYATLSS